VASRLNGTNSFILYGKGGEIATNDLENQELTMLCWRFTCCRSALFTSTP